ncbi:antibiotic biosynthesis monooxygenase [Bacteriovoracaceae bacterium]|nr:antibiotic biosynthesis monooxygenase [Bacteriovoracaceae bacterium]
MKHFAVIFKTQRDLPIPNEYLEINKKMVQLVTEYGGYVSIDSVMNDTGKGISISYWKSLNDIKKWKENIEHLQAQESGKTKWYDYYKVEVCEIIREYEGGVNLPSSKTFNY